MTYEASETSALDGTPVEFYKFTIQGRVYSYTTHSESVFLAGHGNFDPGNLKRSNVIQSSSIYKDNITFTSSLGLTLLELFKGRSLPSVMTVEVLSAHEADSFSEVLTLWGGRVVGVTFKGHVASIRCESLATSRKRSGSRRKYSIMCPHFMFGTSCGVVKADFSHNTSVITKDSKSITVGSVFVAATVDEYYAGGYIEYTDSFNLVRRVSITSSTAATKTLDLVSHPTDLVVGDNIVIIPGCAHTFNECHDKFSNAENFGGWPYFPQDNVFVRGY